MRKRLLFLILLYWPIFLAAKDIKYFHHYLALNKLS